ncbi:MAG: family 43 glycosylhydrolase [Candidatus Marinimicrobia bacterium]|nr:family 43 glycosylhydrolase [Candidatus Neomarinimicrobiota bacterium]
MITHWPNGPFIKYEHNPILQPTSGFESKSVYNPAVIVENGKFSMLYRAEGEDTGTGAIGLAFSKDGIHFERYSNNPVMVREYDYEKEGVEDPRLVKFGGTYYLTYAGVGIQTPGNICLATSTDLINWAKKGEILQPRSGAWNSHQIKAGAIVPEKINGKYVMYLQGEVEAWKTRIGIAYSDDMIHWYELLREPIMRPRSGYFDSMGTEPGAAVVLEEGILLIYNGWNEELVHKTGWALFSKEKPTEILARSEEPILESTKDWEGHVVFTESIVEYNGTWYLHYGIMDKVIGVATYRGSNTDLKMNL